LAESWSAADDAKTWSFTLRQGARFSDGSPLTAPQASASLHVSGCAATAAGNTVRVACVLPHPHLAADVAEVQNSVVVHAADGSWLGSGPFIARVPSGSALSLRANDNAWRGRPFVDAIEITTARALRDQALDYDLGRADVIEISPEQARRATQNGARIAISPPVELIALALQSSAATGDERVRQALSAAIDRDAIHSVLLQRQGQPAAGLLPGWISGYDFLFPVSADMAKARDLAAAAPSQKFTVSYDAADSLAKLVAERVALNARDAGVALQTYGEIAGRASNADIRVLRLRIDSADPVTALAELAARIDPGELPRGDG
jgi:peptide/nickel transport system substrate-binding protein